MEDSPKFPIYRAAFAGLLAMFLGIGVARFGYAPLVPALVAAHWFTAAQAFWLGAVNLLGYFIGAAGMRAWRGSLPARPLVLGLMAATAVSLLASGLGWGMVWFGLWRLTSGVTGGMLMVLMAAAVVGRAPAQARGKVSGITFSGMGAGFAASSLLIPLLLGHGLVFTWEALGLAGVAATAAAWGLMPRSTVPVRAEQAAREKMSRPVLLLVGAYSLSALGFVPHMLFLASFVAIGLHRGIVAGAEVSAWFGVAAAVGPVVLGRVADRFGFLATLTAGYVVMTLCVAAPLIDDSAAALVASAIGVGAVALGAVMLVAGALAGMVRPDRLAAEWGLATMAYAVVQALAAAGFSSIFHVSGSYLLLFGIGVAAMLGSVGLVVFVGRSLIISR